MTQAERGHQIKAEKTEVELSKLEKRPLNVRAIDTENLRHAKRRLDNLVMMTPRALHEGGYTAKVLSNIRVTDEILYMEKKILYIRARHGWKR